MLFEQLLDAISDDNWYEVIDEIHSRLKLELLGSDGFIKHVRRPYDPIKKETINQLVNHFHNSGLDLLDQRINDCMTEILKSNDYYNLPVQYDFVATILDSEVPDTYPCIRCAKEFLRKNSSLLSGYNRLCAVLDRICNLSLSQSRKSEAGKAGESMVRLIFNSVGLEKDIHFSEQLKTTKGSDTDFVLPYVENFDERNIEILIAAQLSTNDRARLVSSELKVGAIKYLVTGNGMGASSKSLKDIGGKILKTFQSENIKLVCFEDEIIIEKNRIETLLNKTRSEPRKLTLQNRLTYFNTHAFSFAGFAKKVEHYKER